MTRRSRTLGGLAVAAMLPMAGAQAAQELTLDMAETMADVCHARAVEAGWLPLNITILDDGGNLKYFRRMDDAFIGSIQISQLKAKTSAMLPFPTRFVGDEIAYKDPAKPHGIQHVPGVVVFPGGLPIKLADGTPIGSIGISGATADQDEECAQAAIDAIADKLQ